MFDHGASSDRYLELTILGWVLSDPQVIHSSRLAETCHEMEDLGFSMSRTRRHRLASRAGSMAPVLSNTVLAAPLL